MICLEFPGTKSILLSRKLFWRKLFSRNYVQVAKELTKTSLRPARFYTTYTKKAPRTRNQWLVWAILIQEDFHTIQLNRSSISKYISRT